MSDTPRTYRVRSMPPKHPQLRPLPATLDIDPRALIRATIGACVVAELGLLMLYSLLAYGSGPAIDPLRELFDLSSKTGLPHWASMAQLLMISLTLWLICAVVKNRGARAASWRQGSVLARAGDVLLVHDVCARRPSVQSTG